MTCSACPATQTLKQAHRDPIGEKAVATLRRGGMRTSWAGSGGGEDEQVPALPVCLVSVVWHAILGGQHTRKSKQISDSCAQGPSQPRLLLPSSITC